MHSKVFTFNKTRTRRTERDERVKRSNQWKQDIKRVKAKWSETTLEVASKVTNKVSIDESANEWGRQSILERKHKKAPKRNRKWKNDVRWAHNRTERVMMKVNKRRTEKTAKVIFVRLRAFVRPKECRHVVADIADKRKQVKNVVVRCLFHIEAEEKNLWRMKRKFRPNENLRAERLGDRSAIGNLRRIRRSQPRCSAQKLLLAKKNQNN